MIQLNILKIDFEFLFQAKVCIYKSVICNFNQNNNGLK